MRAHPSSASVQRTSAFALTLACLITACEPAAGSPISPRTGPPNIILIMVDNLGYADIGAYGSTAIHTPFLDQLAAEGTRFTQAYSGTSLCAPSRATLITGLHAGHSPIRANVGVPLPDDTVTIAEVLKRQGYATGGFGKWGLGNPFTSGVPERQGFDLFFGYYDQFHAHNYYPRNLIRNGKPVPLPGNQLEPYTQFSHYVILDEMIQFIEDNRDRPFFCYAPWTPPHPVYVIPETDPAWQLYQDRDWPEIAKGHAAYVSMLDSNVRRVFDHLAELGLEQNTIVIFTSDNGPPGVNSVIGEHNGFRGWLDSQGELRGYLRTLYEGGIRVPFIVWWPDKVAAGVTDDAPVYFPDLMPTFAEIAGASEHLPPALDGVSLVPNLLDLSSAHPHEYLYWELQFFSRDKPEDRRDMATAVRAGDWKIVRNSVSKPFELYNLVTDPAESVNLAAEYEDIVSRLTAIAVNEHSDAPPQVVP